MTHILANLCGPLTPSDHDRKIVRWCHQEHDCSYTYVFAIGNNIPYHISSTQCESKRYALHILRGMCFSCLFMSMARKSKQVSLKIKRNERHSKNISIDRRMQPFPPPPPNSYISFHFNCCILCNLIFMLITLSEGVTPWYAIVSCAKMSWF